MSAVKARTDVSTRPPLHVVPPPAKRRRTLPNRVAYALAASVIGLDTVAVERPLMTAVDLHEPADRAWGTTRTKPVTWHDPAVLRAAGATLPGREFLQAILDGRLPPPPMAVLLDSELVSVGEGEAVFRCRPDESTYNPLGLVHGGLLCALLDSAAGCAVQTLLPAVVGYASIELKVSFLKALRASSGVIEAHGRALKVGRRVAFAEAHARDQSGELVGHATTSLAINRP